MKSRSARGEAVQNVSLFNLSRERFSMMEQILKRGTLFDPIIFLEVCLKEIDLAHRDTHAQVHHNAIYHREKSEPFHVRLRGMK